MFFGDRGKPGEWPTVRRNYDIILDREGVTIQKMRRGLGFFQVVPIGRANEVQIVYDTDKKLLTGAGLILRKKILPQRTYFSLVRISSMKNLQDREKKSFLGECDRDDQPSDFPVQIADEINNIFNNIFTINLVDVVKHCTPYLQIETGGNVYKIVSGTGYEAEMTFENLRVRDLRTGKKALVRNFSIEMPQDPNYEKERAEILDMIEHDCKELFYINRNKFEIAEVAVRTPEETDEAADGKGDGKGDGKRAKKKKSRKEIKVELDKEENPDEEE